MQHDHDVTVGDPVRHLPPECSFVPVQSPVGVVEGETVICPAGVYEADPQQRALLVGSSGGHLAQLVPLAQLWIPSNRTWVTFDTPDAVSILADEDVVWAHHPTTRNIVNLLRNLRLARRMLKADRPDVIVSTGASVAISFFLIARFLRIPTVFIEVYDRIDTRTVTGRVCRRLASLMCVQWEVQQRLYPDAEVIGLLL